MYGSDVKESPCNAEDPGSIPGSERNPRGGHGNPLQYSCLENPMDRGAWWGTIHGVPKSWTWLVTNTFIFIIDLQYCVNFCSIAKLVSYTYVLFHIIFYYGLSQDIEYSSLYYTGRPCCLSILYIIVCIC